ncbi:hypothetical protein [Reinekea sp. G2M2-21]|uniref:hypothetical protein n=1 Tax=Reinekea sp. G2M2-21 TaxID=2788942 RepID=UPI0018A96DDA|nr:hypothetical protein [Reinekea sp. G2M2-21]
MESKTMISTKQITFGCTAGGANKISPQLKSILRDNKKGELNIVFVECLPQKAAK